jgi:hypothetical protein
LGTVQQRIPELEQRRTAFSSPGDAPSTHTYASDDKAFSGRISGYRGGKADWVATSSFFYEKLGFGNMRFNAWSDRSTRAPHICVELCVVLNVSRAPFLFFSMPDYPFPPPCTRETGTRRFLCASENAHGSGRSLSPLQPPRTESSALRRLLSRPRFPAGGPHLRRGDGSHQPINGR